MNLNLNFFDVVIITNHYIFFYGKKKKEGRIVYKYLFNHINGVGRHLRNNNTNVIIIPTIYEL